MEFLQKKFANSFKSAFPILSSTEHFSLVFSNFAFTNGFCGHLRPENARLNKVKAFFF